MGPFEAQVEKNFTQKIRAEGLRGRKRLDFVAVPFSEAVGRFKLGRIVATPGALRAMEESGDAASDFLNRHAKGDWGDVGREDSKLNDAAVRDGSRILSSYRLSSGEKIWVITEAADGRGNRLATTILLPSEY